MATQTVTIDGICALLGGEGHDPLSKMAISQFVKDGMPKAARGQYDPVACLTWYIGRMRTAREERKTEGEDGKIISLDDAQIRLTTAKAENEEMTAKERRGELMPLSLHVSETAKMVVTVKQRLLNLPARLAPKIEGLGRNESKAVISAFMKTALSDLARGVADADTEKPAGRSARKRTRARAARKPRARK